MKRIIRFIIIFWGIIAIFISIYAFYPQLQNSLIGIGDGGAYVSTWVDENANGVRDENELPLAHVCVWSGYRPDSQIEDCSFRDHHVTNENGQWGEFLTGSSCDTIYIFAVAPDGYQPTTN